MKDCREWRGCTTKWRGGTRGYGQRRVRGRQVLVHRWVWEQVNGPIPDGMVVMHICDNPPCFLIDHLRLGTQAENAADMRAKGRSGSNVVLTAAQVVEIRAAIAAGSQQKDLAEQYAVSKATISLIKSRQIWASIES